MQKVFRAFVHKNVGRSLTMDNTVRFSGAQVPLSTTPICDKLLIILKHFKPTIHTHIIFINNYVDRRNFGKYRLLWYHSSYFSILIYSSIYLCICITVTSTSLSDLYWFILITMKSFMYVYYIYIGKNKTKNSEKKRHRTVTQ